MMKPFGFWGGLLEGPAESFYKNVFCDPIQPIRGSILKVDLVGGLMKSSCHTGIYVGGNWIVEMTNDNGKGIIKKIPPNYFLSYSLCRTGVFIYVACGRKNGKYYPLGSEDIAARAERAIGNAVDYSLLFDNCHLFTEKCISGKKDSLLGTLDGVERALTQKFDLLVDLIGIRPPVHWMSTGVAADDFFED